MAMQKYQQKILRIFSSTFSKYLIIFLFAVGLRALPELLSGKYPVGFDTTQGYIPSILALPDNTPMKLFGWAYSPLAIYFLGFVYVLTKIDVNLLLKIMGPVFYGLLSASFYYMLSKGLGWKSKMGFFVSVLFILQPAVLRTGWDQLREELALIFFFALLAQTKCNLLSRGKTRLFLVSAFSILIVLSHQLIATLLFIVVIWQLFTIGIKRESLTLKPVAAFIPAAAIFAGQLYSQFINPSWSPHFMPIIMSVGTGTFIFTNYFLSDPRFLNGNYLTVLLYVGSLAIFTIMPLIPFAAKGFFKDKVFTPILIWLIAASFSIIIYPEFALSHYSWWMLLLPIPLTIYCGNFLNKIKVFSRQKRFSAATAALIIIAIISVAYASSTIQIGNPYSFTYSPRGLVESSIPTKDIPDVEKALKWANENTPPNATVIVPESIQGFSCTELRSDIQIRVSSALLTLNQVVNLVSHESAKAYAIWYTENVNYTTFIGTKTKEFGSIAVFQINP
jgi:hypothetical protein